jgi:hypothetical protein
MGFRENSSNLFYYTDICFWNMRFLYIFLININFIDKKKIKKNQLHLEKNLSHSKKLQSVALPVTL